MPLPNHHAAAESSCRCRIIMPLPNHHAANVLALANTPPVHSCFLVSTHIGASSFASK
jgi:hypothetical protein